MTAVKYTNEHEWVRVEGGACTVGVTDYAQQQLGDVVFVELPETGKRMERGALAGTVESVKAASEIYAPLSGEINETNGALDGDPALVNSAAEGDGWFFKMTIAEPAQLDNLMDRDAYDAYVAGL
ncbi:MAG TPA: glycine cleavage system protein GcvH [Alphaproteobacteria bacterium]|nr:glycine cleavage system protein GcvH [Alphaproteobacteria bacterium]